MFITLFKYTTNYQHASATLQDLLWCRTRVFKRKPVLGNVMIYVKLIHLTSQPIFFNVLNTKNSTGAFTLQKNWGQAHEQSGYQNNNNYYLGTGEMQVGNSCLHYILSCLDLHSGSQHGTHHLPHQNYAVSAIFFPVG